MTLVVIFTVMTFLSVVVDLIPGNAAQAAMGPLASPALVIKVRHQMDLDQPVPIQVYDFVTNAVQGNLGIDFVSGLPVTTLIIDALPHTLALAIASLIIAVAIGIPLGVYAATHQNTLIDRILATVAISLITMPPYVAGLLLLLLFGVYLRAFPVIGVGSLSDPLDYLHHLVLPAFALAITWIGYIARLVRASMLEVLSATYIRTAYSVGLTERLIHYKYALKNALIPVVAVLGVGLGSLIGGAIFIEVIFSRPGLGTLVFNATTARNFPIVRGGVLVIAILFVMANLAADVINRWLDPRIRLEGLGSR